MAGYGLATTPKNGFNTQPPEGGWLRLTSSWAYGKVSTHSRPKAAGLAKEETPARHLRRFNTQPPEGGWLLRRRNLCRSVRFNTQPPEGGWAFTQFLRLLMPSVSTHSRPKAAGSFFGRYGYPLFCFNTQPPEGGWFN